MIGYKLFRMRKDGTLGSLFINRSQRLVLGAEYQAEEHRTSGYLFRPGWHIMHSPEAPHLTERGRKWFKVRFWDFIEYRRPPSQGGLWFVAQRMCILGAA